MKISGFCGDEWHKYFKHIISLKCHSSPLLFFIQVKLIIAPWCNPPFVSTGKILSWLAHEYYMPNQHILLETKVLSQHVSQHMITQRLPYIRQHFHNMGCMVSKRLFWEQVKYWCTFLLLHDREMYLCYIHGIWYGSIVFCIMLN